VDLLLPTGYPKHLQKLGECHEGKLGLEKERMEAATRKRRKTVAKLNM